MSKYIVICQNAEGETKRVGVTAASDEKACEVALKGLNTWKAVRPMLVLKDRKP